MGFGTNPMLVCIFVCFYGNKKKHLNKIPNIFSFIYVVQNVLFIPMIKLSKTRSPQKLFDYDCVTLYILFLFALHRLEIIKNNIQKSFFFPDADPYLNDTDPQLFLISIIPDH